MVTRNMEAYQPDTYPSQLMAIKGVNDEREPAAFQALQMDATNEQIVFNVHACQTAGPVL